MAKDRKLDSQATTGIAVDSSGAPAVDPTENVKALSEAANKRQDDLREAQNTLHKAEMHSLTTIVKIYGRHNKETDDLRSYYAKEIRDLDSKHYAAIRQIDVTALQALAVTTSTTAESLRSLVQSTATTIATQTANTFQLVIDRIAALEKSSYEGAGKERATDPMMTELLREVRELNDSRANLSGRDSGIKTSWGVLLSVGGLVVAALTVLLPMALRFTNNPSPVATQSPQVIYVPAPPGSMLPTTPPQAAPR